MNELLEDPQSLGVIVGIALPLVTGIVQRPTMPTPLRVAIAVVASFVAGTTTVLMAGAFDASSWLTTVAAVLVAAQASYESIWKPSGVAGRLEGATTPRKKSQAEREADLEARYKHDFPF
jgi:hypothetical protein